MTGLPNDALRVGETLPPLVLPPLTRATLALYAGGSGDHIPLHIDSDFAKAAGHRDVFMHGMLGVAYLVRMITHWVPQERLRDIHVRFSAITYPGEQLTAAGVVSAIAPDGAVALALTLRNAQGEVKIAGGATVVPQAR
ncbi:MAG: dehydratase [Gemmatimonadetes bacterium]|nr:dehydratase [Gemmatimonadota bacterium]